MKKIFTFFAVAMMAVCASAQTYTIDFTDADEGNAYDKTFGSDGFTITTGSDTKIVVDANSKKFGTETDFVTTTHRLKTGGSSNSKRTLTLAIPVDGNLYVYLLSSSNSDLTRTATFTQDGNDLATVTADGASVSTADGTIYTPKTVAVSAGTIDITFSQAVNFHGFKLVAGGTGVNNAKVANTADVKAHKIISNGAVTIVKDGKSYNALGQQK